MKKYAAIAMLSFKAQLAWRFDIFFGMLYTAARILFAAVVWGVLFGEHAQIGGLSYEAMLSFYVVSSAFAQLEAVGGTTEEIIHRIRNGLFTPYMVAPINAEGRLLLMSAGGKLFHGLFTLGTAALSALLFRLPVVLVDRPSVALAALLLEGLGLLFSAQLNFLIGILAFKLENTSLLHMIKSNIMAFVTGAIVPLVLLPEGVRAVFAALPFYYVTYLPSMLLIGRETERAGRGFLVLAVWIAALFIINRAAYDRLRKRYEGVGV